MTQLVLRTARYHRRREQLQEVTAAAPRRPIPVTHERAVGTEKLPPLKDHNKLKSKMINLIQTKQKTVFNRSQYRLPPI